MTQFSRREIEWKYEKFACQMKLTDQWDARIIDHLLDDVEHAVFVYKCDNGVKNCDEATNFI